MGSLGAFSKGEPRPFGNWLAVSIVFDRLSFSDRRKSRRYALAESFVGVGVGVEEGAALAISGPVKSAVWKEPAPSALPRMSSEEGNVLPTTSTTVISAATYKMKGSRNGHRSWPLVVVGAISKAYC